MVDNKHPETQSPGMNDRGTIGTQPPGSTFETIYPCPFSKNYGIPSQQAWSLLKVFLIYRLMLGCLFIILFYNQLGPAILGSYSKTLFSYSSLCYLILTIVSGICIFQRLTSYTLQAQILISTDIIIITLIMHSCGGINSGLGILLAVSIASGGLLIGGRCAMLFAALATLSILAEQIYTLQIHNYEGVAFTNAGMLGASFFTIALLSLVLAQRTEKTAELADQRQQTIHQLEELNQYIIQHLQSGIIISDENQRILMCNGAALKLAHLDAIPENLAQISGHLEQAFNLWLHDPSQDFAVMHVPSNTMESDAESPGAAVAPPYLQSEIQIRFMLLPTQQKTFHMIILEDIALYNQRLQQSKLASLGQLTASIAHEIRNPLGAISHAGQLLSENPELSKEDKRLTEIIQKHSLRVNQIIEDILQLSRRSASFRKKIDLAPWLDDYLDTFILENGLQPETFDKIIEPSPMSVLVDPTHLKQIVDNLCNNALKYGRPEHSAIILSLRRQGQNPCLDVIDSGPGISPAHQNHLFEPFFTTSADGTGLGLYISKELAELNQAKLSYHVSEAGQSCFTLCLPDAEQTIIEI
ncbi:MAG: sensor histidine kinase [Gammaproteobacteria bacterium]